MVVTTGPREQPAADELVALCARLPLALNVAAARAASHPAMSLRELCAGLREARQRLEMLSAEPGHADLGAVFSWSYDALSAPAARLFRLLGIHPGPDIGLPAAASLAALDLDQARQALAELAGANLVTEHALGRYALHDLLRAYAAGQAHAHDCADERHAALCRVLDHYLHTATHSAMLLLRSREPFALAPPSPGTRPERLGDHRKALAWFGAEHEVLLAAVTLAAETGEDSHAWQLPRAMMPYLCRRGYVHELVTVMSSALAAATRLDDALGQAVSLRGLGNWCAIAGNYDQGRAHLERCLPLYQRLGDRKGEGMARQGLAKLAEVQGRFADALGHSEQALGLFQVVGDEAGEAEMLGTVGWFHALLGDYERARSFCEQSLALSVKLGGCPFEYNVWDTLGYTEHHLGGFARAAEHFEVALGLCRDHGNRYIEAEILTHAGDARRALGEVPQARRDWRQALAIYDEIQHPDAGKVRARLASAGPA